MFASQLYDNFKTTYKKNYYENYRITYTSTNAQHNNKLKKLPIELLTML